MYCVHLKPKARKQLKKLSRKDQKRVAVAIDEVGRNPFGGKKLEGEYMCYWSVRVWPYRIIYFVEKKIVTVTVVAIGQREDVYKRLKK